MVVDDFQTNTSRLPRATHASDSNNIGQNEGWHDSSRIIRVSRDSGGKDRHSKVWTSRGLRDRRIRLSVTTAIQFYDIQDRLGYDQPSKAVEWLIQAAADPISELPSLNTSFSEKSPIHTQSDCAGFPLQPHYHHQHHLSLSKSDTSFISETPSKGSGLSLSRDEFRVNRSTAKEKNQNNDPISENGSFTELLTGGDSMETLPTHCHCQWSSHEYLNTNTRPQHPSMTVIPAAFNLVGQAQDHQSCPNSSHLIPQGGNDYDFTMCSCLAGGFNRGTLQSNSPSHLQRFDGGSNLPFLVGAPMQPMADYFPSGLENRLHLCYGDATGISEPKGKGKS